MNITPEQARAELARRRGGQTTASTSQITPEMARAELERRRGGMKLNPLQQKVSSALTPTPPTQSLSPGSQFSNGKQGGGAEFIAKDILGVQPEAQGFWGKLFQGSIGSRGAAGVGQDIGKAVSSNIGAQQTLDMSNQRSELTKTADMFIEQARNEQDPARKARLLEQARTAISAGAGIGQQQEQIAQELPQVDALATGGKMFNAGLSTIGGQGAFRTVKTALGMKTVPVEAAKTFGGRVLQSGLQLGKEGAVVGGGSAIANSGLIEKKPLKEVVEDTVKGTALGYASGFGLGTILPVAGALPKLKGALTPESPSIMNRVARLNPSDAQKFERLAGKSHGQYLTETGNFGTPQKIVENEAVKFSKSLDEVDNALAALPGNHKSKPLEIVLDDLIKREREIGVPNAESARIGQLAAKARREGLDMTEINWIKRKYERDVKLGYYKEQNAVGIARSTRLDSALREWQLKTANELGLKNLDELNKQTQLSKFIVDKLGKQLVGKSGNQAINLTDWIILSGGDPTAIASFLAKKGFLNKGFQAGFAKFLSRNQPKVGQKTAEKVPQLLLGAGEKTAPRVSVQSGEAIPLPARSRSTVEAQEMARIQGQNPTRTSQVTTLPVKSQPNKLRKTFQDEGVADIIPPIKGGNVVDLRAKPIGQSKVTDIVPRKGKSVKDSLNSQRGFISAGYVDEGALTTKILSKLEGKKTVSRQFIEDLTNSGDVRQAERDLIRKVLDESSDSSPLAQEARKYKSAEEFANNAGAIRDNFDWSYLDEMKARKRAGESYSHSDFNYLSKIEATKRGKESRTFYRAGSIGKDGDIWLTPQEAGATQYGSAGGTKVGEYKVATQNPLILQDAKSIEKILGKKLASESNFTNSPSQKQAVIDYAKKNGYDSVLMPDSFPDGSAGMESLVVWDKNLVKTKSQLTDLYNQATKGDINVSEFSKRLKEEMGKSPVQAFGKSSPNVLKIGAIASAGAASLLPIAGKIEQGIGSIKESLKLQSEARDIVSKHIAPSSTMGSEAYNRAVKKVIQYLKEGNEDMLEQFIIEQKNKVETE